MFWKRPFHDRGRDVDWVILFIALLLTDNNRHTALPLLRFPVGNISRGQLTPRFTKFQLPTVNQNDYDFYYTRPWFTVVNYAGWNRVYFRLSSWRRITLPKTRAILQYFLGISFDNSNSMEKMPMTNPINWNTDLPWALLPVVKILARSKLLEKCVAENTTLVKYWAKQEKAKAKM